MFSKKDTNNDKIDTLIGENTKFEGTIEAKGTIRLDGVLFGNLNVEGNVVLGKKGKVKGNINCNNIIISGTVEGNIITNEQLRITATGKVFGDIDVKNFIVDENAIFEGSCKMKNASSNENNEKVKKIKGA